MNLQGKTRFTLIQNLPGNEWVERNRDADDALRPGVRGDVSVSGGRESFTQMYERGRSAERDEGLLRPTCAGRWWI